MYRSKPQPAIQHTRVRGGWGVLASVAALLALSACSTDLRSTTTDDASNTPPSGPSPTTTASGGGGTASASESGSSPETGDAAGDETGDGPSDRTPASASCDAMVREAAFAVEVTEQVELFDDALIDCPTVDQLLSEINKYPGFSGYSTEYLIVNRCRTADDEAVRNSDVCQVATPTTTMPTAANSDVVYVAETLDGRQVELRPSPDLPFIDDAPAEIKKTVDVAIARGCDGAYDRRDLWYTAFERTGSDEASVFAQHAQNVAALLNCELRPLPTPETASATVDG